MFSILRMLHYGVHWRVRTGILVLLLLALNGCASQNPTCQPLFEMQDGNVPLVLNTAAGLRDRRGGANTVLGFSPRGGTVGQTTGASQGEARLDDNVAIGQWALVHERDSLRIPVSLGTHTLTAYRIRVLLVLPGAASTDAVYREERHIIDYLEDEGFDSDGVVALCGSRRDAFVVPRELMGLTAYMNIPSDISGPFDLVVAVYEDNSRTNDSLLALKTMTISIPPHVGPELGTAPWMYLAGIPAATPAVLCDEAFALTDGSQICSADHVRARPTCLVVSVRGGARWWGARPPPHGSAAGENHHAENEINFMFETDMHTLNPLCDIHLFIAQSSGSGAAADAKRDHESMKHRAPPYLHMHNTRPLMWDQIFRAISDIRDNLVAAHHRAPPTFIEVLRIDCGGCEVGQPGAGPGDGLMQILGMAIGQVIVRRAETSVDSLGSMAFLQTMREQGFLMFHTAEPRVRDSQLRFSASSFSASTSPYTICSNYSADRRPARVSSFVKLLQTPPPMAADPLKGPSRGSGPDDSNVRCLARSWPLVQAHVRAVPGFETAVNQTCLKLSLCGTPGLAPAQLCAPRNAWVHWFRPPHPLVQRAAVVRLLSDARTGLVEPGVVWHAFYRAVRAATSLEVIIGTRDRAVKARNALLLLRGNGGIDGGNPRWPQLGSLHVSVLFEATDRVHDAAYAALQDELPSVGFVNRSAVGGYWAALRQTAARNVTNVMVMSDDSWLVRPTDLLDYAALQRVLGDNVSAAEYISDAQPAFPPSGESRSFPPQGYSLVCEFRVGRALYEVEKEAEHTRWRDDNEAGIRRNRHAFPSSPQEVGNEVAVFPEGSIPGSGKLLVNTSVRSSLTVAYNRHIQGTMALIHSIRSEWDTVRYAEHPGDLEGRWIGLQWLLQHNNMGQDFTLFPETIALFDVGYDQPTVRDDRGQVDQESLHLERLYSLLYLEGCRLRPYDALTKRMLSATHWLHPSPWLAWTRCPSNLTQALEVVRHRVAVDGHVRRDKETNELNVWRNKAATALLRWIHSRYAQFSIRLAGDNMGSRAGQEGEGAVLTEASLKKDQLGAIWEAVRALVAPADGYACPPNAITCTTDSDDSLLHTVP